MRRLFALPLVATLALVAGCSSKADGSAAEIRPSGVEGARSFDLTGFDSISVAGPDNVVVRVGPAASVSAAGDTGILDQLEIKVVDGDLEIGRKQGSWFGTGKTKGATITVTLPALTGASIAGTGDMDIDTVSGAEFDASIAGSGSLKVAALKTQELEISLAGSGGATFAGTADKAEISIAGSGDVDAAGLTARTADISIAGSGGVKAAVTGTADVSIIGSGDVEIGGGGTCKITKIGSGDVRCTGKAAPTGS